MSDMRDEVLDMIEEHRAMDSLDSFSSGSMRWRRYYFSPKVGLMILYGRKEVGQARHDHAPVFRLEETTRENFEQLPDNVLLHALQMIIRQASRQM